MVPARADRDSSSDAAQDGPHRRSKRWWLCLLVYYCSLRWLGLPSIWIEASVTRIR